MQRLVSSDCLPFYFVCLFVFFTLVSLQWLLSVGPKRWLRKSPDGSLLCKVGRLGKCWYSTVMPPENIPATLIPTPPRRLEVAFLCAPPPPTPPTPDTSWPNTYLLWGPPDPRDWGWWASCDRKTPGRWGGMSAAGSSCSTHSPEPCRRWPTAPPSGGRRCRDRKSVV